MYYFEHPFRLKTYLSALTASVSGPHPLTLFNLDAYLHSIIIWIDDIAESHVELLETYEHRYITRQPQLHPVLQVFSDRLLELYEWYEVPVANAMITATVGKL